MKWLKQKVWLLRYALEFKRRAKWGFIESWNYGETSLENIEYYNTTECPLYMAEEDVASFSD